MSIQAAVTMKLHFTGQDNGVTPRLGRLYAPNNTLAQVEAAGFLDLFLKTNGNELKATDFLAVVTSDAHQWLKPVFTNGSCQLAVFP